MSGVSGIGNTYTDYGKLANGKKLQNASDGAADLAAVFYEYAEKTDGK